MIILGLNLRHGDSSACLLKNGKLVCAAEEERFVKVKNCSHFPINAIKYCLNQSGILAEEIDYITHNSKKNYNLIHKLFFFFKYIFLFKGLYNFASAFFKKNISLKKEFNLFFGKKNKFKLVPVPHHLSHLFSSIGFKKNKGNNLVFSFDGSGDFSTIETYLIKDNKIKLIYKNNFPNSLGFLYTTFSQFLGFKNYGDEYKVMGLSGYGKPIYYERIMKLLKSSVPFKINMKYFNIPSIDYLSGKPIVKQLFNDNFTSLFGKPRNSNQNEDFIKQIYKDYAASIQKVFEHIIISYLRKFQKKYACKKLFLTGGCALNGLLAHKIIQTGMFEEVKISPAPGDAGGAIGSAIKLYYEKKQKINLINNYPFSGPRYSDEYIQKYLINNIENKDNYKIKFYEKFNDLASRAALIIKKEKVIFWFQDAMEFGPRALGNRSILADPSYKKIKYLLNKKIKKRELFRPFGPAVIKEFAEDYFYMNGIKSQFMNIIFKAKENTKRLFPGVVHVDGTSRVQTVSKKDNKKFYQLLIEFYKITNCPILINTSLNINGPIARSPSDAFNFFLESKVKYIVLNNWLIQRTK